MAHEILSAKLCEMDTQLSKLHSRILVSERYSDERLDEEISGLELEIKDQIRQIQESLKESKADVSTELMMEFAVLRDGISHAMQELQSEMSATEFADVRAEQQILAAEYYIDFATLVSKNALLQALEAERADRVLDC